MAEPIFFDVLPKFGFAAFEAGAAKFKAIAKDAGVSAGASLSEGTDTALKKVQASYVSAANVATKAGADVSKANASIGLSAQKAAEAAGVVEVNIKKLAAALDTYGAGTAEVVAAENRLQAAWARSDTAIHAHAVAYNEANAAMARNVEATAAATAAQAKMVAAQGTASASTLAMGRALNTVGAVSAVAFTAAMYGSAKAAGDFEQSQTRLVSSAGETRDGMKLVSDGILKLAGDVGYSAGELSQGMYIVESAGFRGAEGLKVMTAAAQGAKAENADLTKVNDGLTTSLTDFHLTADDAGTVMSKLVTAVGLSKVNFEEFTGSLHSVEPVAAAAHLSLDDVYGSLARITQSGTSADQATQNMADAIRHLQGPTDVQAASMAKFGINVEDVQQKLSSRGLAGTMQYLSDTIRNQLDPAGNVSVSVLNENAQAAENAAGMIAQMSPAAAATAQAFANGTISRKEFTGAIKASNSEDAAQLSQFGALELKLQGFSNQYKNGRSLLETYGQALKEVTGTVAGANVALQLSGDHAEEANRGIQAIAKTTVDANGDVKGFAETQETFNAKMADAKAAFGAAAIELGNVFLPTLTEVADELRDAGKFLSEHKTILEGVTLTVGALGGAWLVTKAAMALGSLVSTIGTGMATIGGFVWGLAGKYDALAVSANAAATAEARAASGGGFAAGGAAGTAARGVAGAAAVAAPIVGGAWAFLGLADDQLKDNGPSAENARARGVKGLARGGAGTGTLPVAAADQYGGAGAQAARRGGSTTTTSTTPGADTPLDFSDAAAAAAANRPDITAPGTLSPADAAAQAKKPKGDKNDPIWIAPGSFDKLAGAGSKDVYNPFSQFATGGFTPASLVGFATTFALNQALGNPYGKLSAASKRGETPDSPMYVSNVDVDNARQNLTDAVQKYGPDSQQAQTAAAKLQGTQAALGTPGGYFDPTSGGLSARLPGGGISTTPAGPGAEGWRDTVASTVAKYGPQLGIPSNQYGNWTNAIVSQIGTESGGNPRADNPNDSNGQGGTQHVSGLLQYLPSSYANSGGKLTGLPYMDPVGQIAGALFAPQNADGSPAGIGHGVGWGPVSKPIRSAAVPPTSSDGGLFGGGSGGPLGIYDPSQILGGGAGESPIIAGPGGGGALGIGSGASRGPSKPVWQPSQTTGRPSGYIGGAAAAGPRPIGGGGSGGQLGQGLTNRPNVGAPGSSGGRQFGAGQSGKGFGIGGGVIGTAESAAATAANIFAPGSGVAVEKGTELINRAIGYAGQLAGIGVSGVLETFGLNDSALADPGKSLIGRLAGGFAGAHKTGDNVAGQSTPQPKAPDGTPASGNGSGPPPGPVNAGKGAGASVYIENLHNNGNPGDGQSVARDIDRHVNSQGVGQTRGW